MLHTDATVEGIWVDPAADIVERQLDGARIFRVRGRHTVAVFATARDWHESMQHHRAGCREWDPINPFAGDEAKPPNAFSCLYRHSRATAILSDFNARFASGMAEAFNVTDACQERALREGTWNSYLSGETRSWMLALHSGMTHDTFHADGCERNLRPSGLDFFTVLSYPPASGVEGWDEEWGGHVEFAPRACGQDGVGRARTTTERAGENSNGRVNSVCVACVRCPTTWSGSGGSASATC